MTNAEWAAWVSAIGTVAAGAAAVFAVGFAAVKGPGEIKKWRLEKRETKRAEVAGEAIAATISLVSALKAVSTPEGVGGPAPPTDHGSWRDTVVDRLRGRWRRAEPDVVVFRRAIAQAAAYLPDNANSLLRKLEMMRRSIETGQALWATGDEEMFRAGFGPGVSQFLDQLQQEITNELRPMAQHLRD